jgi:23S rRNA G2445 N2-methylase RlmL
VIAEPLKFPFSFFSLQKQQLMTMMRRSISLFTQIWGFLSLLHFPRAFSFVVVSTASRTSTCSLKATADHPSDESSYLATCIPGLAQCLADELQEIHPGINDIAVSGKAAVTFSATREASLHALCWTRTAHRLLELIADSTSQDLLHDRNDLHSFINREVDVKNLLGDGKGGLLTLSVKAVLNSPRELPQDLSHSHYTALTVKNALCDAIRDMRGDRPDVDKDDPDVPLVAIFRGMNGGASVSLYKSLHPPGSLHKRGYRTGPIHKAAMKESLAAGLLREAEWHKKLERVREDDDYKLRLIDPMCGSGSLVLEAAMMATDISPGLMRVRCHVAGHALPPVTRWKSDIDTANLWKEVLLDASKRAKSGLAWIRKDPTKLVLQANDIHPGAISIMEDSADAAGLLSLIEITNMDCYDLEVNEVPCFVVTNPPWGVRLTDNIVDSWEGLRHFLRDVCPSNTEAWVLSGHKAATLTLKLRRDKMIPLQTGDQHLRWIQYTIRGTQEVQASNTQEQSKEGSLKKKSFDHVEDSW